MLAMIEGKTPDVPIDDQSMSMRLMRIPDAKRIGVEIRNEDG